MKLGPLIDSLIDHLLVHCLSHPANSICCTKQMEDELTAKLLTDMICQGVLLVAVLIDII